MLHQFRALHSSADQGYSRVLVKLRQMQIAIACSVNTESSFTDLSDRGSALIPSILLVTNKKQAQIIAQIAAL